MPTSQTSYVPADDPCPTCAVIYPEPHRQGCPEYKPIPTGQEPEPQMTPYESTGEAPPTIVKNDRVKIMEALAELARRDREREEKEKNPPPPVPTPPPVVEPQPEPPKPQYPGEKLKEKKDG